MHTDVMDMENLFGGEVINGDWKQREIFDGLQHVKSRSVNKANKCREKSNRHTDTHTQTHAHTRSRARAQAYEYR
jgi:hypothetical protein